MRNTSRWRAAQWFVRTRDEQLSPEEHDALRDWVLASPENDETLREMDELWTLAEQIEPREHWLPQASRPSRVIAPLSIAACLIVAAMGLLALLMVDPAVPGFEMARTVHGERDLLDLPDRSTITLNANSEVEYVLDEHRRRTRLVGGEAFFRVAPEARPFTVVVGEQTIRVTGTAFGVQRLDHEFALDVIEGRVEVRAADRLGGLWSGGLLAEVNAGERVVVSPTGEVLQRQSASEDRLLGWMQGYHVFSNVRLENALADINGHSPTRLRSVDPRVLGTHISGKFELGDVGSFVEVLELAFGIQAVSESGVITLFFPD